MQEIINASLKNSYTYKDYRNKVLKLVEEGKSTGNEQSEALTHYSELNEVRMNRLDKTIVLTEAVNDQLSKLQSLPFVYLLYR